jgi:major curlin subunit
MKIPALIIAAVAATTCPFASPLTIKAAEAGQLTIDIKPHGKDARLIRQGLQIYSFFEQAQNKARISQNGNNNTGVASQHGRGDLLGIAQNGNNHSASVSQNGNNDAFGLVQIGKGANGNFSQNGNGQLDLVLQAGW